MALLVAPLRSSPCVRDAQHQLSVLDPRLWEQGLDVHILWSLHPNARERELWLQRADGVLGSKARGDCHVCDTFVELTMCR